MVEVTDLKTLKDIFHLVVPCCGDRCLGHGEDGKLILEGDLRVEAIKWIKEIHADDFPLYPNKDVKLPWFGQCITLHGGDQIFAAKVVLQAFFNIKEEDLK